MYLYSSYIIAENKMSDKNIIIEVNGMLLLTNWSTIKKLIKFYNFMQTIFVLLELLLAFEVHNFSYQVTVTFFNVTRDPVTMVYTTC